jgi:hypothetical protein
MFPKEIVEEENKEPQANKSKIAVKKSRPNL